MKKLITILFILCVYAAGAQEYQQKNLIKFNSLALIFNNATLLYERPIMPRLTGTLGFGYKYNSKPPGFYFSGEDASMTLEMGQINGYSITPEIRYYLKSCETAYPSGFYAGLYYRFTRYKSDIDIRYREDSGTEYYYNVNGGMNEHGVGFQLGYQLHITSWFFIDFLIMGPRFSFYRLDMKFAENINTDFIKDAEIYLQNFVDKFGISYTVRLDEIDFQNLKSNFTFLNWRYGLSIGIAF
jgi:hypothetical protein